MNLQQILEAQRIMDKWLVDYIRAYNLLTCSEYSDWCILNIYTDEDGSLSASFDGPYVGDCDEPDYDASFSPEEVRMLYEGMAAEVAQRHVDRQRRAEAERKARREEQDRQRLLRQEAKQLMNSQFQTREEAEAWLRENP